MAFRYPLICVMALFVLWSGIVVAGNTDSIDRLLDATSAPRQKVMLLNTAANAAIYTNTAKAFAYNKEARQLLEQENTNTGDSLYLETLHTLGLYYAKLQLNDSVIAIQSNVYHQARIQGFNFIAARAVAERALSYEYQGQYKLALTDYYTALRLYETLNDMRGVMNEYLNIGLIYQYLKQNTTAISLFNKAIRIGDSIHNEGGVISAYNNLAIAYQDEKKYEQALFYFTRVLHYDLKAGDSANIGGSYNNIGVVHHGLKQYQQALSYFKTALHFKEQQNDFEGYANTSNNIAEVYTDMGSDQAVKWIKEAFEISSKYHFNGVLLENYRIGKAYYKAAGDYKKALEYSDRYEALKDSMSLKDVNVQMESIRKQYELEKAAKEIAVKNAELERRDYQEWIYLILTLMVIITAMYLYFTMQNTRHLNKQLSEKQQQVIDANRELISKNQEAEKARHEAEEASRAKSQFLSVMSHEIRTPLNAIIGLANLLNENDPRTDQLKNITVLKNSSENLLALLNDILDFNKIEAGKMKLEFVDFDLHQLVQQLYNLFYRSAEEKGLRLVVDFDEHIPSPLSGDSLHLNQVLLNLISNAIKFTKEGAVTVSIKLVNENPDDCGITFTVADTGIGIAPQKVKAIFDPFIQADSRTTREFGGTGLGLYISKQLLNMLDADLHVKSEINRGSTFSFTLRLNKVKNPLTVEIPSSNPNTPDLSNTNILIVEDNAVNVFVIRQFLSKWNANTVVADNGEQAIRICETTHFDLILMDLHMPVIDGFEASRQILKRTPDAKIVAITATQETEISDELTAVGIIDFIGKPFRPEELSAKIRKLLGL